MRDTTRCRRNAGELKLAEQQAVVLGMSTLSSIHLNKCTGLVVRVSGEDFGLFGGNGVGGDDTSSSLDTEAKRRNVEEKALSFLRVVTREDGGLDGRTIGYSLIRADTLVELLNKLLNAENVGNKFDDTGNTSRSTDEDDFMDIQLVDLGVTEHPLSRFKSKSEEILAEPFEMGMSEGSVELTTSKSESFRWMSRQQKKGYA